MKIDDDDVTKEEEWKVLKDGSEVLENTKFEWTESFKVCEMEKVEEGKVPKWAVIEGAMMEASGKPNRNGRKYMTKEVANQQVEGLNVFVDHDTHPMNSVGIIESSAFDGRIRTYRAKIRNTARNPDVVEAVKDSLIKSVSIGAMGTLHRMKEGKGEDVSFEVHDLDIREMSLVGVGGFAGATVNFMGAIEEKFNGFKETKVEKEPLKKVKNLIVIKR